MNPDVNPGKGAEEDQAVVLDDMTWDGLLSQENVVVQLESGHVVDLRAEEDDIGGKVIETMLLEGEAESYYSQQPASGIGFRFGHYLLMKFGAMIEPKVSQEVSE